jgi:hypothetical protein
MIKSFFVIILTLLGLYYWWADRSIHYEPGILVDDVPLQRTLKDQDSFLLGEYVVTPLATFSMDARVLSKNWYRFDDESDIVPVDLALGWGPMSDEKVLEKIDISQSDRKYFWSSKDLPLTRKQVIFYSANMHIIPADEEVLNVLKEIREGHIISLSGYLVQIQGPDGKIRKSSLRRTDVGDNSCELIYVEEISIL